MPTKAFTLQTLANMDGGRNAERFINAIKAMITDMTERPGDTQARKLTMIVTMKPAAGQDGVCDETHVTVDFKLNIPQVKSKVYSMSTSANGTAFVNDASLDSIRQMTIDQTTGEVIEGDDAG
jgi:hypothetical protein